MTQRTYYLDWMRIAQEAGATSERKGSMTVIDGSRMPWLPMDSGDRWLLQCHEYWDRGFYVCGPTENTPGEDVSVCNALWTKYNADDRPDGQSRRSMSVGDVIQIRHRLYLVRGIGFYLVNWKECPCPTSPST